MRQPLRSKDDKHFGSNSSGLLKVRRGMQLLFRLKRLGLQLLVIKRTTLSRRICGALAFKRVVKGCPLYYRNDLGAGGTKTQERASDLGRYPESPGG